MRNRHGSFDEKALEKYQALAKEKEYKERRVQGTEHLDQLEPPEKGDYNYTECLQQG